MPRKLLIALLAFGTVAGFGSGFASVARHMRGGWGHGCHARFGGLGQHGWGAWRRGGDPAEASNVSGVAASGVGAASIAAAPLAAAAPRFMSAPVAPAFASPYSQPIILTTQSPPAAAPVVASPYAQPIIVTVPPSGAPQAGQPAQQLPPIHLNLTVTPNGQVQATAQ